MHSLLVVVLASVLLASGCKRPTAPDSDPVSSGGGAVAHPERTEKSPVVDGIKKSPVGERVTTPAQFWTWFSAQEKLTWPPSHELLEKIGEKLKEIDPGLGLEISKDDNIVLAISASGDAGLFDLVQKIVASAPTSPGLRIVAFRQRGPVATYNVVQPDGHELSSADVWFSLGKRPGAVELDLFVRDFPDTRPGQKQEDVYLLLDNALGELDVVKNIASIAWHKLPQDPAKAGLSPLVELPAKFDRALARN